MKQQQYYIKYEVASKTQYVIEDDKVVSEIKFQECPYVWFGKYKDKIESGLIKFVMWKKYRMV